MGIRHIATLVWSVLGCTSLLIGQTAYQQPVSQAEFLATPLSEPVTTTQSESAILWQSLLPELAALRRSSADAAFIPNAQGYISGFSAYGKAASGILNNSSAWSIQRPQQTVCVASVTQGFNVLVKKDARLGNGDIDGPLGIGDDIIMDGNISIANQNGGDLTVNGHKVGLIIEGDIDWGASTGTGINLNQQTYVKVANSSQADAYLNGTLRLVEPGQSSGSSQRILVNTNQPTSEVFADVFSFTNTFNTLESYSAQIAALPANNAIQNGPNATLTLQSGQNVIELTGSELNTLNSINFLQTPSASSFLVINVDAAGTLNLNVPNLIGSVSNASTQYILWNFYNTTTLNLNNSIQFEGSILAPKTTVNKNNSNNINGMVMAYAYYHQAGEVHYFPFLPCVDVTLALTAPPTPTCAPGNLSWENTITINGTSVSSSVRLKDGGQSSYTLPITLPTEFSGAVEVTIDEAISWDGYLNRTTVSQPNEQWKVAFFKNGALQGSSAYTSDLTDNDVSASTTENLGTILLPNGADEVKLIHYEDDTYGAGSASSSNSVNPVSVCMSYQSISSCSSVSADGFILNDLTGNNDITLEDGKSYLFSSLPTRFNLEALASGSNIERVAIYVNGDYIGSTLSQTTAPYEFPRDNVQWYVGGGSYTVTEKVIVNGDTCQTKTISFVITGGDNLGADCDGLVNGSFENGSTGWTLGSNTQGVNTEFHLSDGTSAFSINQIGFTGADAEIHQDVALAAEDEGCTYKLDFYAGTTDNWYTHKVYLELYNTGGTLLSSEEVEIDSDIWYNPLNQPLPSYSLSAVVPTGATTLRIKGTASGDFLKLDGFCLTHSCPVTCTEVTDGGLIGNDQENCGPYNPEVMLNIVSASPGSSEKIEYQWRYSADSAIDMKYWAIKKNWSEDYYDIAGEQRFTVYFVRMARCEDDTDYVPSNIVTIKVNRPPIAHFGFDQGKCALDDISFEALNRRDVTYSWSFPNSLDPTGTPYAPVTPLGRNVTTSYLNPGLYEATLTVTDTLTGCVTTSTDTIGVDNCNTCSNLTSAGAIDGSQASCTLPFDPDPLTEFEAATGGVGNMTYQWYSTTDPLTPFMEWNKLDNSNSATYDPGSISETTYYIRAAKRDNCNSWLYSNTLTVEIGEDIEYLCTSEEVSGETFTFQLPGTEVSSFGDQYRWVGDNGSFTTYYDGTAYLRGTIENINNINLRWEVNLKLVDRSDFIQWEQSTSALAGQYMPSMAGGSLDHMTWNYYTIDSANSYFLGVYYFDGDTVRPGEGYVQRGKGANKVDTETGWALSAENANGQGTHLVCTPICIPSLKVTCKVLLAGFIDGNTGNMRTFLKTLNLLPSTQPYGPIFGYHGTESITTFPSGMVDWVLLELRSHDDFSSILERKAVILLEDGTLLDPSTDQLPVMTIVNALDDHYLVVRHRNHMGIMSATPEGNSMTATVAYDFTQSVDKVYQSSIFNPINPPAFQLPDGRWALIPGDIDATRNQLNNASDGFQITQDQQSASLGYFLGDLNGDGVPNATDQYILWSLFLNMYGHLPFGR